LGGIAGVAEESDGSTIDEDFLDLVVATPKFSLKSGTINHVSITIEASVGSR
jgi:hypothetical protein